MSFIDAGLEFSDAQAVGAISSGSSVVSTNVRDMATGHIDAWDATNTPEIGGSTWNCNVNLLLVGASAAVVATLVTKTADASISSGATTLATLNFAAVAAAGTRAAIQLPEGTTTLRYLGVLYTASGAKLTSASFDSWLGTEKEVRG